LHRGGKKRKKEKEGEISHSMPEDTPTVTWIFSPQHASLKTATEAVRNCNQSETDATAFFRCWGEKEETVAEKNKWKRRGD